MKDFANSLAGNETRGIPCIAAVVAIAFHIVNIMTGDLYRPDSIDISVAVIAATFFAILMCKIKVKTPTRSGKNKEERVLAATFAPSPILWLTATALFAVTCLEAVVFQQKLRALIIAAFAAICCIAFAFSLVGSFSVEGE